MESYILQNKHFRANSQLVVAISGGVDSVVLAHLLKNLGYSFSLAHCNFKLRGEESESDEAFCRQLAAQLGVKFYVRQFDTAEFAARNQQSVQMAARQLRYAWFRELLDESKQDYLLTAHHANDTVETVLINLLRGTGIKGIKGIREKNGRVLRPLLQATRDEIEAYALQNKLEYRQDSSNNEGKYVRNFIRKQVVTKLKEIKPDLEKKFRENALRFNQEAAIVEDYLEEKSGALVKKDSDSTRLDKSKLRSEKYPESLLNFILKPLGFNKTQQLNILQNILTQAAPGKNYFSRSHELTIDRKEVIIRPAPGDTFKEVVFHSLSDLQQSSYFKLSEETSFSVPGKNQLLIDAKHLAFPLTLRLAKRGDKFVPFGMPGFKLLSDFLREEKLNVFEKQNCKVLVSADGEIIWVIGYRSDNRFRVDPKAGEFFKLSFSGR